MFFIATTSPFVYHEYVIQSLPLEPVLTLMQNQLTLLVKGWNEVRGNQYVFSRYLQQCHFIIQKVPKLRFYIRSIPAQRQEKAFNLVW